MEIPRLQNFADNGPIFQVYYLVLQYKIRIDRFDENPSMYRLIYSVNSSNRIVSKGGRSLNFFVSPMFQNILPSSIQFPSTGQVCRVCIRTALAWESRLSAVYLQICSRLWATRSVTQLYLFSLSRTQSFGIALHGGLIMSLMSLADSSVSRRAFQPRVCDAAVLGTLTFAHGCVVVVFGLGLVLCLRLSALREPGGNMW